jgi:hypothetical protein
VRKARRLARTADEPVRLDPADGFAVGALEGQAKSYIVGIVMDQNDTRIRA